MTVDLNRDQKIKLKRLFEQKNYSKFESFVEKLGSLDDLPKYLLMGYASSKVLNSNSKNTASAGSAVAAPLSSPNLMFPNCDLILLNKSCEFLGFI